jgi:hypothetical protein
MVYTDTTVEAGCGWRRLTVCHVAQAARSRDEAELLEKRRKKITLYTPWFTINAVCLAIAVISLLILVPTLLFEGTVEEYNPFAVS